MRYNEHSQVVMKKAPQTLAPCTQAQNQEMDNEKNQNKDRKFGNQYH